MKTAIRAIAFWGLVLAVTLVMSTTAVHPQPSILPEPVPTWLDRWDVAKALITLLFGLGVWFSAQKLASIDRKFDLIFKWKDSMTKDFAALQAEHDLLTKHHRVHGTGGVGEEANGG